MFVVVDMVNVSWVWTRLMLEGVNKVTPRLRWVSVTVWMGLKRECSSQALLLHINLVMIWKMDIVWTCSHDRLIHCSDLTWTQLIIIFCSKFFIYSPILQIPDQFVLYLYCPVVKWSDIQMSLNTGSVLDE